MTSLCVYTSRGPFRVREEGEEGLPADPIQVFFEDTEGYPLPPIDPRVQEFQSILGTNIERVGPGQLVRAVNLTNERFVRGLWSPSLNGNALSTNAFMDAGVCSPRIFSYFERIRGILANATLTFGEYASVLSVLVKDYEEIAHSGSLDGEKRRREIEVLITFALPQGLSLAERSITVSQQAEVNALFKNLKILENLLKNNPELSAQARFLRGRFLMTILSGLRTEMERLEQSGNLTPALAMPLLRVIRCWSLAVNLRQEIPLTAYQGEWFLNKSAPSFSQQAEELMFNLKMLAIQTSIRLAQEFLHRASTCNIDREFWLNEIDRSLEWVRIDFPNQVLLMRRLEALKIELRG